MKMKHIASLPLAVVFAGLLVPDASLACSCETLESALEALAYHDAVFTGRVVEVAEAPEDDLYVLFKLSAVWKGELREDVAIRTYRDEAGCGYYFEVGGEYLVYSSLHKGTLYTSICTRTNRLAAATDDVEQLGEPMFRRVATSVDRMSWGGVKRGLLLATLKVLK